MTRTHTKPVTLPVPGRQLAKIRRASERSGLSQQEIVRLTMELGLAHVARTVAAEGVAK
jgi:hypothetical protein